MMSSYTVETGNMYKFLTDDYSSSRTAAEKDVDSQICEIAEEIFELYCNRI